MTNVSLDRILHNALDPVQYDAKKVTKYKWIVVVSKTDETVQYVDASTKGSSIEKSYRVMNREFSACKDFPSISKEQKMQLQELKLRAKNIKNQEKNKHSSFFGKIYLIIRGYFNGGHIDKVSRNLDCALDKLLEKPLTPNIEDLDTFLNLVSPKFNDLEVSFIAEPVDRKWFYSPETGIIQDKEYKIEAEPKQEAEDIQVILEVMNDQLAEFGKLEEVTAPQKIQMEKLKNLIIDRSQESPVQLQILEKIDKLLILRISTVESEAIIQEMLETKKKIYNEIFETEKTFLKSIENSISCLECLDDLKDVINYSSKFRPFFQENVDEESQKASLGNCIEAFKILKTNTENLIHSFENLMQIENFEERDQELAKIYKSELFIAYAKQVSVCTRYNPVLSDLKKDLTLKNKDNAKIKPYLQDHDPSAYYIATAQRLPRHQLLMSDLTKNTPGHYAEFRSVHDAFIEALSHAASLDKRMNYPFKV